MLLSITIISLFFSLFWVAWFVYHRGIQEIFTNHIVLTNIFFFIIHVFLPFLQWDNAYFRYDSYEYGSYVSSLLFVFFLNVVYTFTLLLFKGKKVYFYQSSSLSLKVTSRVLHFSVIVFMIGSMCVYLNLKAIFSLGLEVYIRDRISLGVGNGLTQLLAHWVYISCLLFFFVFLLNKKGGKYRRLSFLLFFLSFFVSVGYYSLNSNRNSIFLLLINIMAMYFAFSNDGRAKITYKQLKRGIVLVFTSVLLVVLFFQLGKLRHSGFGEDSELADSYSVVRALNGAFGNHENIAWLLSNEFEPSYGATYTAALTNFVPRSMWADKPLGAGPILKNTIYPGSYVVGQSGNSSLTTGLFTEALMNFGEVGVFALIIMIALLLSSYLNFLKRHAKGVGGLLLIFSVVMFSSQFLYAEFLGFLVRYVFSIIPIVFCYLIQVGDFKNETNITRHG